MFRFFITFCLAFLLSACGGGSSSDSNETNDGDSTSESTSNTDTDNSNNTTDNTDTDSTDNTDAGSNTDDTDTSSSSLYYGYYVEDTSTNPEDPTTGSIYMNIPNEDGQFNGKMSFTYYGCQSSNVGTVSGTKSGSSLSGNWSGNIDGTSQAGLYTGSFNSDEGRYSGTYSVTGGKQFISIENCIEYYIAPMGNWYLYPQDTNKTFDGSTPVACTVSNNTVSWFPPAGYYYSVLSIIDKEAAEASGDAILYQEVIISSTSAALPSGLVSGKTYTASVASFNSEGELVYISNKSFTH